MAITEIPPTPEVPASGPQLHQVPVLVIQLQDDLARSRLREAFWMSVIVHLLLILAAITSPRWISFSQPLPVRTAEELIRGKELTYLALPHDEQKVEKAPDTNKLSDKNRIATSRHPVLDKRTLDELRDSSRPGPPGASRMPVPAQPPQPAQQGQMAQSAPGQQGAPRPPQSQTQARLESPLTPGKSPFSQPMSAGSALAEAARAAAAGRNSGYGGAGGDYGSPGSSHGQLGAMEILDDTQGVDFGPYLSRVIHDVKINWYNLIPEIARPPIMKRGRVAIEFAIMKNGQVAGLKLAGTSGDTSLDRAAWGGITGSNPFPPLPTEFQSPYLHLRFHFFYNPDKTDLQ